MAVTILFLRVFTGINVLNMYSSMVFKNTSYNPIFGTFLYGIVGFIGSIAPNFFLHRFGRKTLVCASFGLCSIFHLAVIYGCAN